MKRNYGLKTKSLQDICVLGLLLIAITLGLLVISGCSSSKSWVKLDVGYSTQPTVNATFILEN